MLSNTARHAPDMEAAAIAQETCAPAERASATTHDSETFTEASAASPWRYVA
jgi:hypothetical protein